MDTYNLRHLHNEGFTDAEIQAAVAETEKNGSAMLGGYLVRYRNDTGEMIFVHPSWNGIYVGDYNAHIIFQRNISYCTRGFDFANGKYRELPAIMEELNGCKTSGYILCECDASSYQRRKKQVEKLGYTVYKSNISYCKTETSTCVFLVA